jgi:hypothetical protein
MANQPSTAADEGRGKSFFKQLSSAAAKKVLTPLLAAAATAGASYLTRKSTEIWQEDVLPKVREKGGGKAVTKEALEKVAGRLNGRYAQMVNGLAERLGEQAPSDARVDQGSTEDHGVSEQEERREEERRQRQQRRQQRQRALQDSAPT